MVRARTAGLGEQFVAAVIDGFIAIEKHPLRYSRQPNVPPARDVHRLLLRRFPYAIVYEVRVKEAIVLAIAHARRRSGYWKKRGT